MARINFGLAFLGLFLLCNVALGDVVSTTSPVSCQDATAATVDGDLLLGTWYEAARKTGVSNARREQCIQLVIQNNPGTITVLKTFSRAPNKSKTINTTVTYDPNIAQESFSASFDVAVNGVTRIYKILDTDYENYAFVCAYVSSETSSSTSGNRAFILTREKQLTSKDLARLTTNALNSYSDFKDLAVVNQSNGC